MELGVVHHFNASGPVPDRPLSSPARREDQMSVDPHNFFSLPPERIMGMRRAVVMQAIAMKMVMAVGCLTGIGFTIGIFVAWW